MMKPIQIRLADNQGREYRWHISYAPSRTVIGLGKPHKVNGWEFTDHEGYTRFSEGNWLALVYLFKLVADNYGLKLQSELS